MSAPAEALRMLAAAGCPACRAAATADDRGVFAFVTEHYGDPGTVAELRAALGFCPPHTRLLLDRAEAPWVMRAVYAEVAAAALERLRGASRTPKHAALCPLCRNRETTERTTLAFLVSVLRDPQVEDAYRAAGGCCLPHATAALTHAGVREALMVLEGLADRLGAADGTDPLVALLAGHDPDAAARHRLRSRIDCDAPREPSRRATAAALRARLRLPTCPCCLVAGRAERGYLAWLARERRANPRALAAEGLWLCPAHLRDLHEDDPAAAGWAASLARSRVLDDLARVRAALRAGGRGVLRTLVRFRRPDMRAALVPLVRNRPCSACRAVAATGQRDIALVLAALADGPTARRYERSHGLCLRHVLRLKPEESPLAIRVLTARLQLLAWDLEEAGRKAAWPARHEAKHTEMTAWLRAPALLDGRAFLGLAPAPRS